MSNNPKGYRFRPVWAEIDADAIRHNLEIIRSIISEGTEIMAVVKANAYGHGAQTVALEALAVGATKLGVASIEEGEILRQAEIKAPILILSEITPKSADAVIKLDITPTVCSIEVATAIDKASARAGKTTAVHIKIDTGMNRLGVKYDQASRFIQEVNRLENVDIEGVFTHFATADGADDGFFKLQLSRFAEVRNELDALGLRPLLHAANSAAAFRFPESHFDMVRIGIAMYGLEPFPGSREEYGLQPVMSLKANLTGIKRIVSGEGVSYGLDFKADQETVVGLVPIGYADGVNRRLSNKAKVCVDGDRVTILGRICMDQLMIDLTGIKDPVLGMEVAIFGVQGDVSTSIEELADIVGTINYELACAVSSRVPRITLRGED